MCEDCKKVVDGLPPFIRDNVQEQAANLLATARAAAVKMHAPDTDEGALTVLNMLSGFLQMNMPAADDGEITLAHAYAKGAGVGHAMRCSKNSMN